MNQLPTNQSPENILRRIDTIIQELQELRQLVKKETSPVNENISQQLFGALGTGTWEEYDSQIDWTRFDT